MYQEHFGFNRRPFVAVPNVELFVENETNRECLDKALVCIEGGQGIAILTAPAGVGKTILCYKLTNFLKHPYVTILLQNSNFADGRAFLQAFLFELGRKYVRMDEQELRIELTAALRNHDARDEKVVLIVDESENLKPDVLEEIRTLANQSENGRPLVRVVLAGQPSLEERLMGPEMSALNQRVRGQLYLYPLSKSESKNYFRDQIELCGQHSEMVIQGDALQLIVDAADGNCRCLNQLADHSLLLAYLNGERPVARSTVRSALDDLKQLPLNWNDPDTLNGEINEAENDYDRVDEPLHLTDTDDGSASVFETTSEPIVQSDDDDLAVFEVGSGLEKPLSIKAGIAAPPTEELSNDSNDDIIELPADEDSYSPYLAADSTPEDGQFSDWDDEEFDESEEDEEPILLQEDADELKIPLVPFGSSNESDSAPALSVLDQHSDDLDVIQPEAGTSTELEDLESFADHVAAQPASDDEVVFDRYAWLDAGGNPNIVEPAEVPGLESEDGNSEFVESSDTETAEIAADEFDIVMADPPTDIEPSVAHSFATADDGDNSINLLDVEEREMLGISQDFEELDVVHPPSAEESDPDEIESDELVAGADIVADVGDDVTVPIFSDHQRAEAAASDGGYSNLFSRLRKLQMATRELDDRSA